MSNRIIVTQSTSNGAAMLCQGINSVFEGIAKIKRAKEIMNAAQYGDPADNTALAAEFGVQGIDQPDKDGKAGAMAAIAANAIAALEGAAIGELRRLDQG